MFFFFSSQSLDGTLDLPEHHLRDIAGARAENGNDLRRVEIVEIPEVIGEEVVSRVNAAAGQQHKADAGSHGLAQPNLCVQIVQFFEETALFDPVQIAEVVCEVVFHHHAGAAHQALSKAPVRFQLSEGVGEVLNDGPLVSLFYSPDGNNIAGTGIGICHIEHISQFVLRVPIVHQQGDALCALVDPSAEPIPGVDFRTSRCGGPLGMDQELLFEGVLVVVRGGGEKCHIPPGVGADLLRRPCRQFGNDLIFARHGSALLISN